MVGFKFSSLIVFLSLMLVGCMPSNKQTDCGSNEAFSASLRTCVPIIPSEDSFIHIKSFAPSYNISANKNNTNNIVLAVGISNPYNQAYTLNWRRNFNGMDVAFYDDDAENKNRNFMPSTYSSQVGAHVITVQVLNSSNEVIDSHSWTITLTNNPTPFLKSQVPLNAGVGDFITSGANTTFTIVADNNQSTVTPSTQISWTLDGAPVKAYTVAGPTYFYQTGTSATTFAEYTTPAFNTLALGNHTVSAVLRDSSNIYSQFTWTFNIVNPPKTRVSGVFTRGIDSNSNNQTIIARTGVPYSNTYDNGLGANFRNFFLTNAAQTSIYDATGRTDHCIRFERDYGAQAGSYMDVSFYLDGNASPVATLSTSSGDDMVCLSDATPAELQNVVFNNANPNATENHYIRARIYDQFITGTGKTYQTSDFTPTAGGTILSDASGAYVQWTVVVKPQNDAPSATFGATQLSSTLLATPLVCSSTTATEKTGCEVFTDTDFKVSMLAASDDFYMLPFLAYADANFNYTLRLYRNSTLVHTCSKTLAGMDAVIDGSGPEFDCTFNIPSFGATGPINTGANTYHIEGEISDVGSPYSAYGAVAKSTSTFKWNLNVQETNNAPVIQAITPANGTVIAEGATVNFSVSVDDMDRDNHKQEFALCTMSAAADPTCSSNIPLASLTQQSNRTTNALNTVVISSINLTENFLHQLTDATLNCRNLLRNATCSGVRFLVSVTDDPSTPSYTGNTVTQIITYDITNTNPAPQYDNAQYSPDESLNTHEAIVGVPFILNPGTISDASNALVLTERETRYQWYSSVDNSNWVTIPGATSLVLNWTPASENNVYLKLCMQDQPIYVIPTVDEEICTYDPLDVGTSSWVIKAHRNYVALNGAYNLPATKNLMAVWKGPEATNTAGEFVTPVFTTYVDDLNNIVVEKSVLKSNGEFLATGFATVAFSPIPPAGGAAVTGIKDLSITGTDGSLYISYLLQTDITPTQFRYNIRRIDISGTKSNIGFADNKSFGFSYTTPTVVASIPADITVTTGLDGANTGTYPRLQINNATTSTVTINGVVFTPCAVACSNTDYATALVNAVNSYNATTFQGIYAVVEGGNTVIIKGQSEFDYYTEVATSVDSLGQTYIQGTNWNSIYVISSTKKLNAKTAPVNIQLAHTTPNTTTSAVAGLNAVQASTSIVSSNVFNEAGTDYILVGSIATSGSVARAYKLEANGFGAATIDGSISGLFDGKPTYKMKVAATNGVNKYFIVGDAYDSAISPRNYYFVKLGAGMGVEVSKTVSDPTFVNESTEDLFDYNGVYDVNLVAYTGGIARVFVVSDNTSARPMMFTASLKLDNTLSCHGCAPVSGGPEVSNMTSIALSQVRLKTSCVANGLTQAHCLLGTEGYDSTAGVSTDDANYKDVIFTGYTLLQAPGDFQSAVGVFNLQNESIHSSSLDSTAGKYRPSFFTP